MATVKISALPPITTPALTDIYPTVQAGVTYKVSGTQLGGVFVPVSGGTMTGTLTLSGPPVNPTDAADKAYVDSVAQGLLVKAPVDGASTAALTVNYNNGASGVGATLTNNGAQATFAIDGITQPVGARILIKDQASTFQNGIYSVTNAGSGATNWVLTRTTDFDGSPTGSGIEGAYVFVEDGTVNAGTSWVETGEGPFTIGITAIVFSAFSAGLSIPVILSKGGSNAALVANNGGVVWSNATQLQILAGTATANQMLQSGSTATPAWSTSTWPATTVVNQLLFSSATNTVGGLTTANDGVLVTGNTGIPSILAGPGSANKILVSNTAAAPAWSTVSYPSASGWTNFTPTITLVGGAGNTVPTFTTNEARYQQIGNVVFVIVYLNNTAGNVAGAGTGQINIAAPIAVGASAANSIPYSSIFTNGATSNLVAPGIVAGATTFPLAKLVGTTYSNLIGNDLNDANGRQIQMSFFYEV